MRTDDEHPPTGAEPPTNGGDVAAALVSPAPATAAAPAISDRPGRVHLVVVVSRAVRDTDRVPPGMALLTRFWHPRDRRWSENAFESLEHALHLFIEESGWTLRQQQAIDGPHAYELIFEARRVDFDRPSTEEILADVGLTRQQVADFMRRPGPRAESS
ncbi:MAG TPA: hypothetical protein VFU46_00710 [Gemmatimonadales bacterium]|nr:hypothetical protein [Gemmatimonadales bacterium]